MRTRSILGFVPERICLGYFATRSQAERSRKKSIGSWLLRPAGRRGRCGLAAGQGFRPGTLGQFTDDRRAIAKPSQQIIPGTQEHRPRMWVGESFPNRPPPGLDAGSGGRWPQAMAQAKPGRSPNGVALSLGACLRAQRSRFRVTKYICKGEPSPPSETDTLCQTLASGTKIDG